jgi:N-carbamoylputrescine amidase
MTAAMRPLLLKANGVLPSPARAEPSQRPPFRIGAVQHCWHPDGRVHQQALSESIRLAAAEGAQLICLAELTISRYFAVEPDGDQQHAEEIPSGPTSQLIAAAARETNTHVQASLFEKAVDGGLGYDTAVVASPEGRIVAATRKLHIPRTAGYHEDRYFAPGPPHEAYPVISIGDAKIGFPTCWDEWFPELARIYSLAGAEVIVYPSAIGSEPDHPEFDTAPLWEKVIVANGIMNGTFMVATNRVGNEGKLTFYGSSFISDPYGRKLVQAPRDQPAVLIADLDLDQRRDWLALFPFLATRRPDTYGALTASTDER